MSMSVNTKLYFARMMARNKPSLRHIWAKKEEDFFVQDGISVKIDEVFEEQKSAL